MVQYLHLDFTDKLWTGTHKTTENLLTGKVIPIELKESQVSKYHIFFFKYAVLRLVCTYEANITVLAKTG